MDVNHYYNLLQNSTYGEIVRLAALDYLQLYNLRLIFAFLATSMVILTVLVLVPLSIVIPQIIMLPWKLLVKVFYKKKTKEYFHKRNTIHALNFHLDLTRPSHIHLFELLLCFAIISAGGFALFSSIGGSIITGYQGLGILIPVMLGVWLYWGAPWMAYWQVKAHDMFNIGDKLKFGDEKGMLVAHSCAFMTFVRLDDRLNIPSKPTLIQIRNQTFLDKYTYFECLGTASKEERKELKASNLMNDVDIGITVFGKTL